MEGPPAATLRGCKPERHLLHRRGASGSRKERVNPSADVLQNSGDACGLGHGRTDTEPVRASRAAHDIQTPSPLHQHRPIDVTSLCEELAIEQASPEIG